MRHAHWLRRVLVVPLAAGAMLGAAACDDESAGPEADTTLEEVTEDETDALVGRTVTVSGEVAEVILPNAFTLGAQAEEEVLVLGAPAAGGALAEEGAVVQVTGTVRDFVFTEFEDDFGLEDEEAFEEFEEENFIVADSVSPAPTEDEGEEDVG